MRQILHVIHVLSRLPYTTEMDIYTNQSVLLSCCDAELIDDDNDDDDDDDKIPARAVVGGEVYHCQGPFLNCYSTVCIYTYSFTRDIVIVNITVELMLL